MRPERLGVVAALALLMAICCPGLYGQQAQKPLTNAGVIKMVKAGLSESVVVATIHASPANFDVSPDGLIALQKARVTQNEMNAMVAATQGPSNGGATAASANANSGSGNAAPAAASGPRWQMPTVAVVQNGASQELPLEKTQLAQTKTKPTSMASLAGDSVMTEGIQAGVGDATMTAATHMSSGVGGVAVEQAGGIFSGALARRKPMTTYVWGVPGPASSNVLQIATPSFTVSFARTPGVNPDDFAPEIVKLTPAQNTCRLIGATRGKEDAQSGESVDWEIYSSFVEERVATNSKKNKPGEYEVSPQAPLLPGEYAVVLRPVLKTKKFSGGDVARAQGPGLMFDIVFSFQVADNAQ